MERVNDKLASAWRALGTLAEVLNEPASAVVRDAAIKRFEYTFEASWKAARLYLQQVEGLDVGSPKGVIRACVQVGLLSADQAQLGLEMTDDRNLTAHTYNEALADAIYGRLPEYAGLIRVWLESEEWVAIWRPAGRSGAARSSPRLLSMI